MADYSWENAVSGDWSTQADWVPESIPGTGDDVTIAANTAGYTVTVNSGEAANTLTISASNATLNVNNVLTMGGVLALGAGTLQLDSAGRIDGGTIAASGGAFVADGGTLDGVAFEGTLDLSAANSSLTITGGTRFSGAGGSGSATIDLNGGAFQSSDLYVLGTGTLDNATIEIGNAGYGQNYLVNEDAGGGGAVLTLGAGLTIVQAGAYAALSSSDRAGDAIVNDGTIEAGVSGGAFTIDASDFTNNGFISVSGGDHLTSQAATFTNLTGSTLTGGTYDIAANSTLELSVGQTIAVLDAALSLSGPGSALQIDDTSTGQDTQIDATLTNIAAAGALTLAGGRNFTSANGLDVTGLLSLGGGTLTTAGPTITAGGTLVGFGTVVSGLADDGLVEATGGDLYLTEGVTGAQQIDAGATLELGAASAGTITLQAGGTETLALDGPGDFTGTLAGLASGDIIDLLDTAATKATLSGDMLIVSVGTTQYDYTLATSLPNSIALVKADPARTGSDVVISPLAFGLAETQVNTSSAIDFGDVRVGATAAASVSITNAAVPPAEGLDVQIASVSPGATASGAIFLLAAGQTDSSGITVGLDTSEAGAVSGDVTLGLVSDGTGTDGAGQTPLPDRQIAVTGTVYRDAVPQITAPSNVIVHVGDGGGSYEETLSVANTAPADGYSEGLDATVVGAQADSVGLNGLVLVGSARLDGSKVQLTAQGGEAGAAWLNTFISADQSFDSTFSFSMTAQGQVPQADGIAFVIQAVGTNAVGGGGGDIGLYGLAPTGNTAAVVFQSWVNNHAGIVLNSNPYTAPLYLPAGPAGVVTGTADVEYNAAAETLTLTSTELLDGVSWTIDQTVSVDLATWVGQEVDVGFTGGTGGSTSDQEITAWNLATASLPGSPSNELTASGATGDIAAGQNNDSALTASVSTAAAQTVIGAVAVAESSDGTGIDTLGLASLGTVDVPVVVTVDNYATAAVVELSGSAALTQIGTNYTVNLGEVAPGSAALSVELGIENSARPTSDLLEGSFSAASGDAEIGLSGFSSFSGLSAGQTDGGLDVTLSTGETGIFTSQITLLPTGTNAGGYAGTLAPEIITITGTVGALALALVNTLSPIDFGGVRAGATVAVMPISISNAATASAQALDATATASGDATVSGAITQLAAGSTDSSSIEAGLNTGTAGIASGDISLSFASEGTSGPIPLVNQGTTIIVTGTVYAEASYALSASPPAIVHVGDIVNGTITVSNTAPAPYSENLIANVTGGGGSVDANPSSSGPIAPQGSAALSYTIDATAPGTDSGTVDLQLLSDGAGLDDAGSTQIGTVDVPVSLTVDNYANPDFEVVSDDGTGATVSGSGANEILNLGTIEQGSGPLTIGLGVLNDTTGPADALAGLLSASGSAAFSATGLDAFAGLGAGQADTAPMVTLDTSNDGTFTETVTLDATGSNVSGYSQTLAPRTLTITGTVADLPPPSIETPGTQAVFADVAAALSQITIDDPDPDGTFTVVVSDAMGVLSATPAGSAKVTSQNGQRQVTISGSLADINTTLANLTYLASGAGSDTVNISVQDGHRATASSSIAVTTSGVPNTLEPILNGPSSLTLIMDQSTGVPGISLTLPPGGDPTTIYSLNISSPGAQLTVSGGTGGTVTGQGTDTVTITGTVAEINSYLNDGLAEVLRAIFLGLSLLFGAIEGGATGQEIAKIALDIESSLQAAAKKKDEIEAAVKAAQAADEAEEIAGDVHFVTNGGNIFQFDAIGEFTLAQSTQSGNDFNVQVRMQASPGSTLGSVVTALAAGFGADTVVIAAGDGAPVLLDGNAVALAVGGTLSLAAGYVTRQSDVAYQFVWNTGEMVTVIQDTQVLDVSVGFGVGDTASTITGLVGPGRTGDQIFTSADGTMPTGQVSAQEFAAFVDSYRVTDSTSNFVYAPGQSTETFTDLSAPAASLDLTTLPAAVLAMAENAVAAAGITDPGIAVAAELDFLLSGGDPNVVQTDAALFEGQTTTPAPVSPAPAAVAFGVISEASQITTAAAGPTTATFMVYLSGVAASDLVVDYTVVAPDASDLDAAAFAGTFPSGQVTIEAGQSTAEFDIAIPQGALGATGSETLEVSATPEGDQPLINTTATSLIVQPQAGSPPAIAITDLASFGTFTQNGNSYLLDLGAIPYSSYPPPQIDFSIANTAVAGSDDLGGTFSASSVIGFTVSGDTLASPIQAGSSYDGLEVTLNEAKFGANDETIVYSPTDTNVSGYSAPLAPITINITYTLEAPTMTYSQAWGDVHIITYNNLEYNFQAVGEFVLAHSTYPGDSFDIQLRLTPFNGSSSVSGISEVALQIGSDRVTFGTDRAATVWLNGAASTLDPTDSLLSLAGGSVSELSSTTYKVVWNTGETATITLNGTYFSVLDGIPTDETGFVSGLQGENEGQQNDFQLPDGTVLAQPLSAATLYGEYADAWRVSPATSLFDYGPGQSTATFTDLNFPEAPLNIASLPASVQAAAAAAVAAAGITDPAIAQAAIDDYIATGEPNLIAAAASAEEQAGTTTAAVITPPAAPPPTIAITADATSLPEPVNGPLDVGFTITLTEPSAASVTVDYSVVAPDSTFLGAADLGGSLPSGQVTFDPGQTTATLAIALGANVLGSRPDAGLEVMVTATDGTAVSIPEAETVLVNPMPEPGPPAIAAFLNQTDGASFSQSGSAYTLNLGTLLLNQVGPVVNVALGNIATAPADSLSGTFSAPTGSGFLVTGNDLPAAIAAGDLYTGLFAGVITDQLGSHSETLTFTPRDVNPSGYQATQTPITLTIEDVISGTALASLDTPSTIVFSNVRVGTAESQAISVSNTAAPPAAGLDVAPSATGDATVSGTISDLAAGATDTTSLRVGLATAAAGAQNGYATLDAASDAGNGASQALPESPTVDVFGSVFRLAAASIAPVQTILHVGDPGTVALSVANTDPNDGFSESLIASLSGASGGISVIGGGPTSDIAAGGVDSSTLLVGVSTALAGVVSGSATVALTSDGGTGAGSIDGLGKLALTPQTVGLSITVDNYAQAAFEQLSGSGTLTNIGSNYTLALGSVAQGAAVGAVLGVLNDVSGPADLLSGAFTLSAADAVGLSGFGAFSGLGAGQADTGLDVSVDTSSLGGFSRTVALTASGSNASGYSGPAQIETLTITGTVTASQTPVLSAPAAITARAGVAVSVGGVSLGLAAGASRTGLTYTVTVSDTFGLLSASAAGGASVTGAGQTSLTIDGTLTQVDAALATLTDQDGQLEADTITVAASDSAGLEAAPDTILVGHTFVLTRGTDTVAGGPGPDLVQAASATLTSGDTISGGGGTDTLALVGAGTFNLSAPASIVGIGTIMAQEGQPASGGIAAQNQIVTLRDGMDANVVVTSDAALNPANPRAPSITVVGAHNAATIQLASGNDTVTVGDARETILGGSGNDTIIVNQTTIGGIIDGGGGVNTLNVTGGGSLSMGSTITNIQDVTLSSAATAYNFTANALPGLFIDDASSGFDTVTAGGAGQMLTGGSAGRMSFIGSNAGGDTFIGASSLLNGDSIGGFSAVGDSIDITDILNGPGLLIGYTQMTGMSGLLSVSNGAHSVAIDLLGQFSVSGFTHTADSGGGVSIGYTHA